MECVIVAFWVTGDMTMTVNALEKVPAAIDINPFVLGRDILNTLRQSLSYNVILLMLFNS